jgi:hypothetical protein
LKTGILFNASSANDLLAICEAPLLCRTGVLRMEVDDEEEDDKLEEDKLDEDDRRLLLDERVSLDSFLLDELDPNVHLELVSHVESRKNNSVRTVTTNICL